MVQLLPALATLAFAMHATAAAIPVTNSPASPQDSEPKFVGTAETVANGSPLVPHPAPIEIAAVKVAPKPKPQHFSFTPSSQYSQQELRRQRRVLMEQPFDHSPYGSGALPVPSDSAETGFGGRTLF